MKEQGKKKWQKPSVEVLNITSLTLSGSTLSDQENTKSKTTKRPS